MKIRRALAQGVSDHQKMNCQFKYEVEIEQERITTIEQIRTIAQKWTQKWAAVLVSCSASCFLLRLLFLTQTIFDFGVAAREPRDIGIDWCLTLPGQLFLGIFWSAFFHPSITFWTRIVSKMDPKLCLVGPTFRKKCENEKVRLDCAGAYGLHVSPSLKTPDATKK